MQTEASQFAEITIRNYRCRADKSSIAKSLLRTYGRHRLVVKQQTWHALMISIGVWIVLGISLMKWTSLTVLTLLCFCLFSSIGVSAHEQQPAVAELLSDFPTLLATFDAVDEHLLNELSRPDAMYTVFAPTEAAFEDIFRLLRVTREQFFARPDIAGDIPLYHTIPGRFDFASLMALDGAMLGTTHPVNTFIDIRAAEGNLLLAGVGTSALVIEQDLEAVNGIVHVIDTVLLPYADWDLRGAFQSDPIPAPQIDDPPPSALDYLLSVQLSSQSFSTLYQVIQNADPAVSSVLRNDGFTLFAPTDDAFEQAFASLGIEREAFLQDPERLTHLLSYHIMPGYFSAYLLLITSGRVSSIGKEGQTVATLLPSTTIFFTVSYGGRPTTRHLSSTLHANDAVVIASDINVDGGLLHVIDRVLVPPDSDA